MTQEQYLLLDFYYRGKRKIKIPHKHILTENIRPNWIENNTVSKTKIRGKKKLLSQKSNYKKLRQINKITDSDLKILQIVVIFISEDICKQKRFLAFQYDRRKNEAPICIAKGKDKKFIKALEMLHSKNLVVIKSDFPEKHFNDFKLHEEISDNFYKQFSTIYAKYVTKN